ncbi:MAG TPA: hypothetical protein VID72_05405, partial [Ktedonobacterales bacterium]
LRVLFAQISGIPYESKQLALGTPDCQKWRNSHFTPWSKAFNEKVAPMVTIGSFGAGWLRDYG